jgi:hypothetical protein
VLAAKGQTASGSDSDDVALSPIIMIIAVGLSGAVGVFFGYYPARKPPR